MLIKQLPVKVSSDYIPAQTAPNSAAWSASPIPIPSTSKVSPQFSWKDTFSFNSLAHPVYSPATWEQHRLQSPPVVAKSYPERTTNNTTFFISTPHPILNPATWESSPAKYFLEPTKNHPEWSLAKDYPFPLVAHPMLNTAVWESAPVRVAAACKNYPEQTTLEKTDCPFPFHAHPAYSPAVWSITDRRPTEVKQPQPKFIDDVVFIPVAVPSALASWVDAYPLTALSLMFIPKKPPIPAVDEPMPWAAANPNIAYAKWAADLVMARPMAFSKPRQVVVDSDSFISIAAVNSALWTAAIERPAFRNSIITRPYEETVVVPGNRVIWQDAPLIPLPPAKLRQLSLLDQHFSFMKHPVFNVATWEQRQDPLPPVAAKGYPERTIDREVPFRIAEYPGLNPAVWEQRYILVPRAVKVSVTVPTDQPYVFVAGLPVNYLSQTEPKVYWHKIPVPQFEHEWITFVSYPLPSIIRASTRAVVARKSTRPVVSRKSTRIV